MRCPGCGAENEAARRFCRGCGAPMRPVCGACGFANEADDRFCGGCGRPLAALRGRDAPADAGPATMAPPERRLVTVLFCDLVGSTALSERLDPEDMRELLERYRSVCTEAVEASGGFVARFIGDGVLAFFGFPHAQEDDPVRAVRAALEIVPAVRGLEGAWTRDGPVDLDVRIGIDSGQVIAGPIGTGGHREAVGVVGEAPNIANRIQNYAEPGAVLVTGATMRLIEGRFEAENLGRHHLRGVGEPVAIFRIRRTSDRVTRFEASAHLTPLVGRETELAFMLDRWARARGGEGQVVLVGGEPGIGKSRLLQVLGERIAERPHNLLRCQCSPFARQSTLHPVVLGLQRAAGFLPDDPPEDRLAKLESFLAAADQPVELVAPLFAALLSVPTAARPAAVPIERQKERTLDALLGYVFTLARQKPLLLTVEDAHWIDPTSLELLERLVVELAPEPVLVVVTHRPEFRPAWEEVPYLSRLELDRLDRSATARLIEAVAAGHPLSPARQAEIVAKTEGVPLFAEELTRAVLEAEAPEGEGGAERQVEIPATLQDSLLARLDRLGEAKELAQIAAAIGREFGFALLSAIADAGSDRLRSGLQRLVEAGLVQPVPGPPPGYSFRHALFRDIAYDSMLRRRRRELHGRIARALPSCHPYVVRNQPELLAYHLTEADQIDDALPYWLRAGQRASSLSANAEAANHLGRGLELLRQRPDDEAHKQLALDFLNARGPALIVLSGPGSTEARANYDEALSLCAELPETRPHFVALWGAWRIAKDPREHLRKAEQLGELAARIGDPGLVMEAHHCQWAARLHHGDLAGSMRHIRAGLHIYEAGDYRSHAALYGGHDAKVCGSGNLALCTWMQGEPSKARTISGDTLRFAREIGHAGSIVHAMDTAAIVLLFLRDAAALAEHASEMIDFARDQGFADFRSKASVFFGWALAQSGELEHGLESMRAGLGVTRAVGTFEDSPYHADMLAEILTAAGRLDEAEAELRPVIEQMELSGFALWRPELHRRLGEVLFSAPGREAEAESEFRLALSLARSHGPALEHRATTSLCRLLERTGRAEAAEVLRARSRAGARVEAAVADGS